MEAPIEKVGPKPGDRDKTYEWNRRYSAAGGMQTNRLAETNDYGIDVRVASPAGLKRHGNMWGNHCPQVFYRWIDAHGMDSVLTQRSADRSAVPNTFIKNVNVIFGARESQPFPWKSDLTLLDVIMATISGQPVMASINSVRLVRDSKRTVFDFRKLRKGDIPNPKLRPEDTVEIPD